MKKFWVRSINFLLIIGVLMFYNMTTQLRSQAEEITAMENQAAEQTQFTAENDAAGAYRDGTYTGEAQGFGGTISMQATVADGKITDISILSADKEDGTYLDIAKTIIEDMLKKQTADVDTISGATFSSTGIRDAVKTALEEAGK